MGDPGPEELDAEPSLPAGDFSAWLARMQAAIRGQAGSDVPCAGCTACCTSSQFIHIGPDETETLARIPKALLSPAPRLPPGHMVLGYDERGHCPMLVDNHCSIYEQRPRTCRSYDCRVLAAAGVDAKGPQKEIGRRARRWRFAFPTTDDRVEYEAVRAAAAFLDQHPELLSLTGAGSASITAARVAAAAVTIAGLFVASEAGTGRRGVVDPDPEQVRVALSAQAPGQAGESQVPSRPVARRG
jgi:hypothetical protein